MNYLSSFCLKFIALLNINNYLIIFVNCKNDNLNKYIEDADIKYSVETKNLKLDNKFNLNKLDLYINIFDNKKIKSYKLEDIKQFNKNNIIIDFNKIKIILIIVILNLF